MGGGLADGLSSIASVTTGHWVDIVFAALAVFGLRLYLARVWRRQQAEHNQPFASAAVRIADQFTAVLVVAALLLVAAHLLLPTAAVAVVGADSAYLLVALVLYYVWRVLVLILRRQADRHAGWAHVLSPALVLTKVVFGIIGIAVVLEGVFGVKLTAIWTTLGVGGVAVALALNDTLSNLFAGFYILVDQPVRIGDFVTLNTGEAGYVQHVGWRSTRIRLFAENIVIIPNSKLAAATITNHNLPDRRCKMYLQVGVGYEYDPDWMERLLLEETVAARVDCPQMLEFPAPSVAFSPGFMDSSMNFTIVAYTQEWVDTYTAAAAVRKRLYRRFRREGVNIPYPVRTTVPTPSGDIGNLSNVAAKTHPGEEGPGTGMP